MFELQRAAILTDGADDAFVKAFRSFGMDFKRDLNLASNLKRCPEGFIYKKNHVMQKVLHKNI